MKTRVHRPVGLQGWIRAFGHVLVVSLLSLPALVAAEPPVAADPAAVAAEPLAAAAPAAARDLSAYKEEQVSGGALAAGAYMVMWVLVAAFVGRVAMRQSQTEAALRNLEDRVDASNGAS